MSPPIIGYGRASRPRSSATTGQAPATSCRRRCAPGVERIVYTCSVATLELRTADVRRRNPSAARGPRDRRLQAQQGHGRTAGRGAWSAQGLPAVIVNPSTPIGPRDVKPTPTGRIIVEAAAGRMPAFVDTGLNMVHVDDVAAGHLPRSSAAGSASATSWAGRMPRSPRSSPTSPR